MTKSELTFFLRQVFSQALQHSPQVRGTDVPSVVLVEDAEGVSQLPLLLLS